MEDQQHSDSNELSKVEQKKFSIDEIIEKYVGGFGRTQLLQVAIVALGVAFDAQHTFVTILIDAQPSWQSLNRNMHCTVIDM